MSDSKKQGYLNKLFEEEENFMIIRIRVINKNHLFLHLRRILRESIVYTN